jgi:hypothetical protein
VAVRKILSSQAVPLCEAVGVGHGRVADHALIGMIFLNQHKYMCDHRDLTGSWRRIRSDSTSSSTAGLNEKQANAGEDDSYALANPPIFAHQAELDCSFLVRVVLFRQNI